MMRLLVGILLMGLGLGLMTVGGYVAKGGWDAMASPKKAAERNLIHLLQATLDSLSYSYRSLKMIPYLLNTPSEELTPYTSPYNLRRWKLKNETWYYLWMPEPSMPGESRSRIVFFIINECTVDKANLHETFTDPDKVDLFFQLMSKCEHGNERLHRFWESTKEADPEAKRNWDILKHDRKDEELASIRQSRARQFIQLVGDIRKLVATANNKWGYNLSFKAE